MLRILSSDKKLCSGLSRRDLLQIGGLGACGLGLEQLLQANHQVQASTDAARPLSFGRAKRCILLYLYGAHSQLETVDMKPEAPVEIRGSMKPIASSLPGLDVCELLPRMSQMMDRVSVVRSVTHPYPLHGVAFATTGVPAIDAPMELAPHDPKHHPYFGSVVQYLDQKQGGRAALANIPQNLALPFPFSSQRVGEVHRAGPYASFLGAAYNPVWTEYQGKALRPVYKTLRDMKIECFDPYVNCNADSHFQLSLTQPQPDLTLDRLNRRKSLLQQFEEGRKQWTEGSQAQALTGYQELAFSLLTSPVVGKALDVRSEPQATRDLYGMTLFGQSCLAARRMVEAGTRLVSVFWDEYGLAGDAWDTHWNHFPRMTDQLLPGLDKAYSGLILDLERRGLLDDTLVVLLSDHGRTPKINGAVGGGRDHWSQVYSLWLAGGGVARGKVIGASDKHAAQPADRPVSPKDILATMYHLLGIDPHSYVPDRTNRPIPIVPETAAVVPELLG